MKTRPPHPDDPLLQALAGDADPLPLAAAARARSRQQLRRTVSSGAVVIILLALGLWFSTRATPNHGGHTGRNKNFAQSGATVSRPAVGSPAEKKLLDDLADAPLLVVRNNSGHLRRVYVLEGAR